MLSLRPARTVRGGQARAPRRPAPEFLPGRWGSSPSLPGGNALLSHTPPSAERGPRGGPCRAAPLHRGEPEMEKRGKPPAGKAAAWSPHSPTAPPFTPVYCTHQCAWGEGENDGRSLLPKNVPERTLPLEGRREKSRLCTPQNLAASISSQPHQTPSCPPSPLSRPLPPAPSSSPWPPSPLWF